MADDNGGQPCEVQSHGSLQDAWQILELAAIHFPDKLAVVDCGNDSTLTYAQLHERAATLAAWLRRHGIHRGDRVGVLCRNSSHVMELHFAAAAIHAVVVNLNIHLAPAELAYILSDSGPKIVFVDRTYASTIVAASKHLDSSAANSSYDLICIDVEPIEDGVTPMFPSTSNPFRDFEECFASPASQRELACSCLEVLAEGTLDDGYHMYYTSGTTGRPKGVVLSHRIVVYHAVGTIKGAFQIFTTLHVQRNLFSLFAHYAYLFWEICRNETQHQ